MSPRDLAVLRQAIDDLAHALPHAIGLATAMRRGTQDTAGAVVQLEGAIGRAVFALRLLELRTPGDRR